MLCDIIDRRVTPQGAYRGKTPYSPLIVKQMEEGDTTLAGRVLTGEIPTEPPTAGAGTARAAALEGDLDTDARKTTLADYFDDRLAAAVTTVPCGTRNRPPTACWP